MVHYYDHIPENLSEWALKQQLFFIASAPLVGQHVNLSPKGLPASTLSIFDKNTVAYIDATGSGIETISHVYENGRATIMFCSFDKMPRIMRWFCTGRVVEWDQPEYEELVKKMGKEEKVVTGARAVLVFHVYKAQTSCGYAVPIISQNIDPARVSEGPKAYLEDRGTLGHWAGQQIEKGVMHDYRRKMNSRSLDGCAGLKVARRQNGEWMLIEDIGIWLRRAMKQWDSLILGVVMALVIMVMVRMAVEMGGLKVPRAIRLLA